MLNRFYLVSLVIILFPLYSVANESQAATAVPTPERGGLFLGVGWPDVKVRYGFEAPIDLEAKAAFGSGMQVYSGRVYWTYLRGQDLDLMAGVEGGYMNLQGADGLYGGGAHGGLFTGVEAPLGRWLRLSVDIGPDCYEEHSGNQSVSNIGWVVTTGIYLKLF
jgi:hypothetical protein